MAEYKREILLPYLRDVCSTEVVCQRLERDKMRCQANIQLCEEKLKRKKQPVPKKRLGIIGVLRGLGSIGWVLFLLIMVGMGIFLVLGSSIALAFAHSEMEVKNIIFFVVSLIFGLVWGSYWGFVFISDVRGVVRDYEDAYSKAVQYNNMLSSETPKFKAQLEKERQIISYIQRKLMEAQNLRRNVYGVNVIPNRYRNIYVAYYLYDYFSTSRERDLDKVIQTLLLDEIKKRLDRIIIQNEEILLNQRYQIALQEKQNAMGENNHREQMRQLARLEHNQELQADYLNMIDQNQNVTNFILSLEFLRKC